MAACAMADADGDPSTTDDQTPVAGWRVYLKVDGVRQVPGGLTSAVGCHTWLDLESGHSYAVAAEPRLGWEALAESEKEFGPAVSGELYRHTFVNQDRGESFVLLPLVRR